MKLSKININPKSLAFVTTDKCTASSNREDASTLSNELKDSVCNNTTNVLKINNPEHMIINMWTLNHDIDSYQVVSGYKRFLTKQVIAHLKETNSPVLAKYSEKQISEFLKGNMLV